MTQIRVELGKIREFARATGSANPVHLDTDDAVIPPTFLCPSMLSFWATPADRSRSAHSDADQSAMAEDLAARGITLDPRRALHGGQDFVFHGKPIVAGEVLTTSDRFGGYEIKEGKRGGSMVFIRSTTQFHDEKGELRLESTTTSIFTSVPASQG